MAEERPPRRVRWSTADAPSARGLSPEQARDEQLEVLRGIRDDEGQDPAMRASVSAWIEALGGAPRLRIVDDEPPPT